MGEETEEEPEITHRVYLDIDIDKQRLGLSSHFPLLAFTFFLLLLPLNQFNLLHENVIFISVLL